MIAGAHLAIGGAPDGLSCQGFARQDIIDAPTELRSRNLRQGAHQVKRLSLSGSSARPTSMSPRASMRSRISLSSGRCPTTAGLRSLGCTSRSLRAIDVAAQNDAHAAGVSFADERLHLPQKFHLRDKIFAAVRHIHRDEEEIAYLRRHNTGFDVESGMTKLRLVGKCVAPMCSPTPE